MSQEDLLKYVKKYYPGHAIMLMTGFEKAFLGITMEGLRLPCAVYDFGKCVGLLMKDEGMTAQEATDHLNDIMDMDIGDYAPHFVRTFSSFFQGFKVN